MTIGEFLKELIDRAMGVWPIRIIQDWEQGLRVRAGRVQALLTSRNGLFGTGIHLFWPLLGEIYKDETNIRLALTDLQTCTTADGRPASFSFGVRYRVRDLSVCWQQVQTYEGAILDAVMCAAGQVAPTITWADRAAFGAAVEAAARKAIRGWGLEITSFAVVNLTDARPLRLLMDDSRREILPDAGYK